MKETTFEEKNGDRQTRDSGIECLKILPESVKLSYFFMGII